MMTLFNILRPIKFDKVILWAMVLCVSSISYINVSLADDEVKNQAICGTTAFDENKGVDAEAIDSEASKAKKEEIKQIIQKINAFCNTLKKAYPSQADKVEREKGFFSDESYSEYKERFAKFLKDKPTFKKTYEDLEKEYEEKGKELSQLRGEDQKVHKEKVASGEYVPCGSKYPTGCPEGQKCYIKNGIYTDEIGAGVITTEFKCDTWAGLQWREKPKGSVGENESIQTNVGMYSNKIETDELGYTKVTESGSKEAETNAECNIQGMRVRYQSSCYSCMVIKTLITTFMDAASNVQDVTTDAGTKILQLGLMIWLAFFALKNVTSLTNVEPGSMINTLFTMLFKCLVAYVFITSGITAFMMYIIEPIMEFGARYGIALMKGSPAHLELTPSSGNIYGGTKIVSASLINNIMGFTESLDKTVSTNLIIGHSLTCHATHAGMWVWEVAGFDIKIPNFWIWLCGAAIWFCGFMLTLGIGYYMLDISFKLGFAIIAFPIVASLWPFNMTKDKFKKCVSIIMKSAATFAMLAMTASYALTLISESLRNLDEFYARIEAGDSEWISDTFDVTGSYFIIIMFAYLYSMKLISSTIPDYVNKFFPDGVFKSDPMHQKLTQVTDMAKKAAVGAASFAGGVVTHQAGKLVDKGLQKGVRGIRSVYNKFKKNDDGEDKKSGGVGGGVKNAGTATKNTGKAMEQTGKATEQTGKAVEQTGKAVEAGGKGVKAGGGAMMKGGKALSATGLGAIVGVPMMIAGGAVKAAGVATEYAGKATATAGKAIKKTGAVMKKSGKAIKKVGEKMEQAGEKMQKVGKGLKDKGDNMGKKKEDKPEDSENPDKQQ